MKMVKSLKNTKGGLADILLTIVTDGLIVVITHSKSLRILHLHRHRHHQHWHHHLTTTTNITTISVYDFLT